VPAELRNRLGIAIAARTYKAHCDLVKTERWRALAAAGKNRVFRMEVAWWYEALADRPVPRTVAKAAPAARIVFYRELSRRLAAGESATEFYLGVMRPILDAAIGARGSASSSRKRKR